MFFSKFDKIFLVLLIIIIGVIFTSAAVLTSGEIPIDVAYHPLQFISKTSSDLTSVDADEDGIIDEAESVTGIPDCSEGQFLVKEAGNWICKTPQEVSQLFIRKITLTGLSCDTLDRTTGCTNGGDSENWVLANIIDVLDGEDNLGIASCTGTAYGSLSVKDNLNAFRNCIEDPNATTAICNRACQDSYILNNYIGITDITFLTGFTNEVSAGYLPSQPNSGVIVCTCLGNT